MMKALTLSGRRSTSTSRLLRCAATAAAFSTLPGSSYAFSGVAPTARISSKYRSDRSAFVSSSLPDNADPHTRLLSSRKNYDYDPDEEDKSFISKAADKVKSFLPTNWFKSEKEKEALVERKRRKEEITGGIDNALKGAPLGVRMMGKMVAPLLSKAVSGIAETMQEQSRKMEELLDDARQLIVTDGAAADALGEPIVVGSPFSQSSSTSNINGKTSMNIQTSFEVMGSRQNGVANMVADGNGITMLRLDVGGRSYNIDVSGKGGGSGRKVAPGRGGDVIDAEIIDADFTEKK